MSIQHPTLLHDSIKGGSTKECSTQTSTNSDQKSTPIGSTINNSLSVCNAVKSNDNGDEIRTSSMIVLVWLYHENDPQQQLIVCALLDPASNETFVKNDTRRRSVLMAQKFN